MELLRFILFYRWPYRLLILLFSLLATVFGLLSPYYQKAFVDQFVYENAANLAGVKTLLPLSWAFFYILLMQLFSQSSVWLGMREALALQRSLSDKIYRKNLSIKSDTSAQKTVGETVALYTTDVSGATFIIEQTLPMGLSTIFPLILTPFAISILFHIPLWPTFSVIFFVAAINTLMALRQSRFFFLFKHLASERIAIVNEWIQHLRVIRILGWTEEIERRIFIKRRIETENRVSMVTNGQIMNAISTSVTFALNIAALYSLLYLRETPPTPGEILALLWILGIFLIRPFRQMPWFFTFGFDAWTSIKRLEAFLSIENPPSSFDQCKITNQTFNPPSPVQGAPVLDIRDLNLRLNFRPVLKNIDLTLKRGEFVAIVGEVGAGKSLLLLSLIGETQATFEQYRLFGHKIATLSLEELRSYFAYVPQEAFIMSASLRNNVHFQYSSPSQADPSVHASLKHAEFHVETERASGEGLDTLIGERGVNLSGGQRQRVSLARADFKNADIVLLDDTFSALDVNTENKLMENLIHKDWHEKAVLLVTHRLSILPKCDRVLFMKDGRILDQGPWSELIARNEDFARFVQEKDEDKTEGDSLEK